MNKKKSILIAFLSLGIFLVHAQETDNVLSKKEVKQGWELLFNGVNLEGWTSVGKDSPPSTGWVVQNGILSTSFLAGKGAGDLITKGEYDNFELSVDFKLAKGGNSGIKYFFTKYENGGWLGLEYQILDNINHPDAKMGINGNRQQAALYDLLPVQNKQDNRVGEWNQAKIVVKGSKVTHYLNGKKVLSYDRHSEGYLEAWRKSKFKSTNPPFGQVEKGHILLQEHGDDVSFKNIKIRNLSK